MRRLLPPLIFLWSLAWILSQRFPYLSAAYDSTYYMVVAKAFAAGDFYKDYAYAAPKGAIMGPSFFPLVLSLYWIFLNPHLWLLKLAMAVLTALAPVAAFLWMRLYLPSRLAFFAALAYGASYMFVVMGNSVMTESLFAPMMYLALWLHARRPAERPEGRGDAGEAALWVALARTRVVGWCFLGVYVFQCLKSKRWKAAGAGAAAAGLWVAAERFVARGADTVQYAAGEFTRTYPILTEPMRGVKILLGNVWDNIFAFTTSIDAHIVLPFLYDLSAMSKGKRLACLAVFLWTAWGAWLAWRNHKALRPWLVAALLANLPTFIIFETHDSFRYLMPYFPFLALFLLAPFQRLARNAASWKRWVPAGAAVVFAACQALHSATHVFDQEYIDYAPDFEGMHAALPAGADTAGICLSPVPYYTYLRTGCRSLMLHSKHDPAFARAVAGGRPAWAFCGPRNQYFCDQWERDGVVFGKPLAESGPWKVMPVLRWPQGDGADSLRPGAPGL